MTRSVVESCSVRLLLAAAVGACLVAPARAGSADDDLQAVKRAVLASPAPQARPPAEDPGPQPEAKPQPRAAREPMWFRVRIVEKRSKRARISVNLPIGLVRSFGDSWEVPGYRGCKRDRCGATLGEILRALDGGQNLVEIEDAEASVRVWID